MSRLILEGDDKQIALLLKLVENMTDVDIVEHIPEASGLNDDDKKSPLYWLDQIRNRGGVSYAIQNPSEWQRDIRSERNKEEWKALSQENSIEWSDIEALQKLFKEND